MKVFLLALIGFGYGASVAAAQTASSGGATFSNSSNCKVAQLKVGESPPGSSLATPSGSLPTASGGRKSAAAAEAPTFKTSSLPDGSKMVTDSLGNCIIYRQAERQPNPSR
jgi:hypothetical protein